MRTIASQDGVAARLKKVEKLNDEVIRRVSLITCCLPFVLCAGPAKRHALGTITGTAQTIRFALGLLRCFRSMRVALHHLVAILLTWDALAFTGILWATCEVEHDVRSDRGNQTGQTDPDDATCEELPLPIIFFLVWFLMVLGCCEVCLACFHCGHLTSYLENRDSRFRLWWDRQGTNTRYALARTLLSILIVFIVCLWRFANHKPDRSYYHKLNPDVASGLALLYASLATLLLSSLLWWVARSAQNLRVAALQLRTELVALGGARDSASADSQLEAKFTTKRKTRSIGKRTKASQQQRRLSRQLSTLQTSGDAGVTGAELVRQESNAPWLQHKRRRSILNAVQGAVQKRGLPAEFAAELGASAWRAYFVNTKKLQYLAEHHPNLLLFPWERMRAMGVVELRHPVSTEYTFFSHQWETAGHPWPDLQQVLEHINQVTTPYLWADWCAPLGCSFPCTVRLPAIHRPFTGTRCHNGAAPALSPTRLPSASFRRRWRASTSSAFARAPRCSYSSALAA